MKATFNRTPCDTVVSPAEGMIIKVSRILNTDGGTFVGFTTNKQPLRNLANGTVLRIDIPASFELETWPLAGYIQGEYHGSTEQHTAGYIEIVFPDNSFAEVELNDTLRGMDVQIVQLPLNPKAVARHNLRLRLAQAQSVKKPKKP